MSKLSCISHPKIVASTSKNLNSDIDKCEDETDYISDEEIPLDPKHLNRVHEELEKLNIATDIINKLEIQLDETRATFRHIQATWSQSLEEMSKKLRSAIDKGRPYYEAKLEERRLREEIQEAAIRFERANSMHAVAKQQVSLSQESLNRQKLIQPECLEVLNHHIKRVNETEKERLAVEELHRQLSERMCEVSKKIAKMQKENGRSIKKSRYYFERRAEFARVLENQKSLILRLEAEVRQKKLDYTTSLRNLEHISDNIHEERSLGSSKRSGSMRQKVDDLSDSSRSDQGGRITEGEQEFRDRATLEDSIALENIKMKLDAMTAETDQKDTIDPSLFDDESATESLDSRDSRPDSLGTGVILLAQQLIGGHEKPKRTRVNPYILPAGASDFRYQTTLPEEISSTAESSPVDYSDSGSDSAISIKTPNIEQLSDMLRSHSQLEVQIEEHASDVAEMLHNVENDLDMKKSKFGKVISRCRNRLDPSALHLRAPSAYS